MNKIAETFLKVAEEYENLARCEPEFNHAQNLRAMARGLKHEAARLNEAKEKDNGNQD